MFKGMLYSAVSTNVAPQSVKAYATMLIDIVSRKSLALLD